MASALPELKKLEELTPTELFKSFKKEAEGYKEYEKAKEYLNSFQDFKRGIEERDPYLMRALFDWAENHPEAVLTIMSLARQYSLEEPFLPQFPDMDRVRKIPAELINKFNEGYNSAEGTVLERISTAYLYLISNFTWESAAGKPGYLDEINPEKQEKLGCLEFTFIAYLVSYLKNQNPKVAECVVRTESGNLQSHTFVFLDGEGKVYFLDGALKDVGGVYFKEGKMDEEMIRKHFEKANLQLVEYRIYDNFNAMVGLFFSNYATYLLIEAGNKIGIERDLLLSNAEIVYRAAIKLGLITKATINGLAWVLFLQGIDTERVSVEEPKEIAELIILYKEYPTWFHIVGYYSLAIGGGNLVEYMHENNLDKVYGITPDDIELYSSAGMAHVLEGG
ncbi:MAG: hypothetical protein QXL47_00135 [Candidatus Anstonellales archaeon]